MTSSGLSSHTPPRGSILIRTHVRTNARSETRGGGITNSSQGVHTGRALFLGAALALVVGCAPNPQRVQSVELLGRLVGARELFLAQPPRGQEACDTVGEVQTRLNYEPGLTYVRPAWDALSQAAGALQAVCGQSIMLGLPTVDSPAVVVAHQRWQASFERENDVACDHLRAAAAALDRPTPC
jgi:hypothetical protein